MNEIIRLNKHKTSFRNIISLSYPLVLSMLSLNIMQFFDRIFLARFDMQHFAACLPSGMISYTFISFFLGIAIYVKDLVSQYYGANKKSECTISTWQGIYISIIMGIILLLTYPLTSQIFNLAKHDPKLIPLEKSYFFWMIIAGIISIFINAITGFFYGTSNTKIPMIGNILANLSKIFFNWTLIFGNFGFPSLGITGAGIGTALGESICLIYLLIIFFSKKYKNSFQTLILHKINFDVIKKLIYFGIPSGLAFFLDVGQWGFFIIILGKIGEKALAAANISIALESISFLAVIGLAGGTSILTGQEKGAGRIENIKRILFKSFVLAFFYDLFILLFFIGIPDILILIFKSKENAVYFDEIKNLTILLIRITGFWLFFDAVRITLIHVLRSLGDALFLMITTFIAGASMVISAYVIVVVFNKGLISLWIIIISYTFVMSIFFLIRFISGRWKKINVI